jgi:DNA-binding NarL/FixJ family response regulator
MDIRMPVLDGVEATRKIRSHPAAAGTRVLILTTFDLDEYVVTGLRAGASGFLLKDVLAADLLTAIRTVHAGDAVVAPAITTRLIEWALARTPATSASQTARQLATLTPRELEVLTLIGRGLSNAEIAGRLYLGEGTVKTHVGRVLSKLALRDRTQAIVLAYESGLIRPGDPAPRN